MRGNTAWQAGRKASEVCGFRSVSRVLARFVLATVVAVATWVPAVSASPVTVTLLHVNDTHSYLDAYGPKDRYLEGTLGGMAKAASVIAAVRAHEPNVLLLHAGDVFQGDLFFNKYFGVPEFVLMKQLGFDAMAVGNHEFAFGPDVLAYALSTAYGAGTLPLLSANLDMSGYPALETWIKPSIIKEVGGIRIGIFGMTTPDDVMNMPDPVVILGKYPDTATLLGIAGAAAAGLRGAGAEVVICLSHLGVAYDQAMAANVPGIDIIVGGHDHYVFEKPLAVTNPEGKKTLILQAGSHYRYVGKLRFTLKDGAVKVLDYTLLAVDRKIPPLHEVQNVVDGLKAGIVAMYGEVYHTTLAWATRDLEMSTNPKQPRRDTAIGNLVTDALRDLTGTDIAITANGVITQQIFRGPIVGADVFRTVSYGYDPTTGLGFKTATFEITGFELLKALETTLAYLGVNEDFFLQVSGMTFAYDAAAPVGSRVVLPSVRVRGQPLDPFATYSATVNEGIAALIPLMGVQVTNLQPLPDLEYDAVKDFIIGLGLVNYHSEGRILDVTRRQCGLQDEAPSEQ
jgi:5'-nucleotidase/UDP-sugar diphosphatase